jgi:fructokinase
MGDPSDVARAAVLNSSIALGRLEVPVGILSGVSNDLLGAQLVDQLHASHVSMDLLIRSDRPTSLAFVKLTKGQAQYTFYDENSAGSGFDTSDLPENPADVSTIYARGTSLCAEPAAKAYEALYLPEVSQRVTILDPNIRLSFISDEAALRARLNKMIANSDVVKVSDEDLDWIIPNDRSLEAKVDALHQLGVKLVILTKGSAGASACCAGNTPDDVAVPKVTVVDTVGADDTFNAGFLAKLAQLDCLPKEAVANLSDQQISAALQYAVQVAAVTVSRKGANPPTLNELSS